jgi:hypothetical protein
MHGITEQEVRVLQNVKQNDVVCVRIFTEHGPYWDTVRVKRLTKTQIITADDQRFWKKDGSAFGGMALFKRIYPLTEERAKAIHDTKLQQAELKKKRKLIFRIKRSDLKKLSSGQLEQVNLIIGNVEKRKEAGV